MRYLALFVTAAILLTGCASRAPEPLSHRVDCNGSVFSVVSSQCLEREAFLDRIEHYPVLFMGDHHLSRTQHAFVADTIRGLASRGYRIHLANEWFSPSDDPLLAEYAAKQIDDGNFTERSEWKKRVSFDFELFKPVYHAVRDTGGMLYGVNLTKEQRKRISESDTLTMDEALRSFYDGLDLNVSAHRQLLSPFFARCHKPKAGESEEACRTRMYRVQVAWDAYMGAQSAKLAKQVLNAPKEKVMVFIGAMHMRNGLGANLRFARECDLPFATVIPQSWDHGRVMHGEADYVYLYEEDEAAKKAEEELIKKLKAKHTKG